MPQRPPDAAWVEAWRDSRVNVAILAVLLSVLTLIFWFQAALSRSRRAHRLVRNGFLAVTLVWLGWTAGVQLSIVNVISYVRAPLAGLGIEFYLAEPLMLIIAAYTLLSVVLIGRGVFCGWLCPFGALQELLAQLSRALDVPQWHPPAALERRLRLGKYIAAIAVLMLGVTAIDPSGIATEVEPFKTAITAKFTRAWPYVAYAGALLAFGLFSERAYCRFLCPLGGVLAILDRLHLVNMLKRRPECGSSLPSVRTLVPGTARSRRPARSSPRSAFSALIARSNTMTTSGARRWCSPPSSRPAKSRLPAWRRTPEVSSRTRLRYKPRSAACRPNAS